MELTNEEKCIYCREYGNLPCDECNKKLEAKKSMSKRLEELYEKMVDKAPFVFPELNRKYVYELAEIYAREVAQASLERASEEATINHQNGEVNENIKYFQIDSRIIRINKQSITNPDNIVML